jgi:hypothetical protein
MPVSCIGASPLSRHRRFIRLAAEVGTNRRVVKPLWRKNHGDAQIVEYLSADA